MSGKVLIGTGVAGWAILAFAAVLPALFPQGSAGQTTPLSTAEPRHAEGYAGQETCASCHREITDSYQRVAMARSFSRPTPANTIEDYEKNNSFFHEKSGFHYTMLERGGRYFQRRSLKNKQGEPVHVHEEEITYILGSGDHARSYFHHHPNGVITKLPVTWYTQEQRWGMSPGYDVPDHLDFTRPIPQGCFFCHTSYPRLIPQRSEDEVYFPNSLPAGIGCERCHGPGSEHVRLVLEKAPAEEFKKAIYHPGLDSKQAQRDLCYQCHLETNVYSVATRVIVPGRETFSYRPGETFSDYAVRFKLRGLDDKSQQFDMVKQHGDLMEESKCFQASGGAMTCTTCHDPHVKVSMKRAPISTVLAAFPAMFQVSSTTPTNRSKSRGTVPIATCPRETRRTTAPIFLSRSFGEETNAPATSSLRTIESVSTPEERCPPIWVRTPSTNWNLHPHCCPRPRIFFLWEQHFWTPLRRN